MNCSTPPIPGQCVSCKNPLEYIFELSYLATKGLNTRSSFLEALVLLLDSGITTPICDYCCPPCGVYVLASVETYLKFAESGFSGDCCVNVYSNTETYLKYAEAVGPVAPTGNLNEGENNLGTCCSPNLEECFNKFLCWSTSIDDGSRPSNSPLTTLDRALDKGIVEYGSFEDSCTGEISSGLCILVEFLKSKPDILFGDSAAEVLDLLLDKGLAVVCVGGEIKIGSVERILGFLEAVG